MLKKAKLNRVKLKRVGDNNHNLTQEELAMALLAIRKAMDIIDDGYHQDRLVKLTEVSNDLFWQLNEKNRDKFTDYLERKMENDGVIKM